MLKKLSTPFVGFLQATGLISYIILISCFFNFVLPRLTKFPEEYYAPILMLMLFVISAVISAALVLGQAAILFWERQYKQAFTLVGWTVFWCIFYLAILILILTVL